MKVTKGTNLAVIVVICAGLGIIPAAFSSSLDETRIGALAQR